MAKQLNRIALLFDFYGPLLTPHQQERLRAYYSEDLSLGEIAEQAGVSRQAVHDQLKRAEEILQSYEDRLGLVAEHRSRVEALRRVRLLLRNLAAGTEGGETLAAAQVAVDQLLAAEDLDSE